MKRLSSGLVGWLVKDVETKASFYTIIIIHVIFGTLLFLESNKTIGFFLGFTVPAIAVPIFYLYALKRILAELKSVKNKA